MLDLQEPDEILKEIKKGFDMMEERRLKIDGQHCHFVEHKGGDVSVRLIDREGYHQQTLHTTKYYLEEVVERIILGDYSK